MMAWAQHKPARLKIKSRETPELSSLRELGTSYTTPTINIRFSLALH